MEHDDYIRRRSSAFTSAQEKQGSKHIIILGATKCGKTSFISRYLNHSFADKYEPTTEDFHKKQLIHKGFMINIEIVDMCGPFIFPVMRDMRIKSADVAILLYEIGNEKSMLELANVYGKITELRAHTEPLHIVVVGTKLDLFNEENLQQVYTSCEKHFSMIPNWAQYHKLTSAKNNDNVTSVFEGILDHFISNMSSRGFARTKSESGSNKQKNSRSSKAKSCAQQ